MKGWSQYRERRKFGGTPRAATAEVGVPTHRSGTFRATLGTTRAHKGIPDGGSSTREEEDA